LKLPLSNAKGEAAGDIEVRDDVFGRPMSEAVVHQVMVGQLANRRQGTAKTKTRAQVSGGGAKPRPQKSTGRARQGSIRSPQWKGGGVVFGPIPRSYRHRTTKRMRRLSLVTTLSDAAREGRLLVLDEIALEKPKTSAMVQVLRALNAGPSVLLCADGAPAEVIRCARNIPRVRMMPSKSLNTLDLLTYRTIVMTVDAVRNAEALWGGRLVRKAAAEDSDAESLAEEG
jgi:large subunit ribosomal protein L4